MAIYRVDARVQDPEEVFTWLRVNVPEDQIVRHIGYKVRDGWHMKIVFKRQADAEKFHRVWVPEADSHEVPPYGNKP